MTLALVLSTILISETSLVYLSYAHQCSRSHIDCLFVAMVIQNVGLRSHGHKWGTWKSYIAALAHLCSGWEREESLGSCY